MIQKSSGVCGYTTLCFLLNWPFPPCEVWHSSLASRCCSKIDVGWEFRLGQTRSWCVRHSPNNLCSLPESVHKYSLASFDKKTQNDSISESLLKAFFCPCFGWGCWIPSRSIIILKDQRDLPETEVKFCGRTSGCQKWSKLHFQSALSKIVSLITPRVEDDYWSPQMSPGMILINLDSWLKWACYIYLLHWGGFNLPAFMLASLMGEKLIWVGKGGAPLEGLLRTGRFGWIRGKWRLLF